MRNDGLAKTFYADGAIGKYLIVKAGSADNKCAQAAAATDKIIGVADLGASGAGERLDVFLTGIAKVVYGGTVARGDLLTSDAAGKAIATTTASNRIIGVAMESGVANDIRSVALSLGSV